MSQVPSAAKKKADEARALLQARSNKSNTSDEEFIDVSNPPGGNADEANIQGEEQPPASPPGDSPAVENESGLPNRTSDQEDWKKRYTNLRATRDEKLTELEKVNAGLEARLVKAEHYISELEASRGGDESAANTLGITEEQRELLTDAEQSVLEKMFNKLNGRIDELASQQAQEQSIKPEDEAARKREAYFGKLDSLAPRWEQTNSTEAFKTWLNQLDPSKGVRRQITIAHLDEIGNAEGVAEMFNDYALAVADGWTPEGSNNGNANNIEQRTGDVPGDLSRGDMTVNQQSTGQGGQQNEVEMVKASDFKQFYNELTKAKNNKTYLRDKEKWDERKAFFDRAAQEGRVVR